MEDDEASLWLFCLLYIGYIMYLNYIQNLSIVRKDWQDMKCNPLFLLLDSFVSTPSQSELSFKKCVIQAKNKQINSSNSNVTNNNTPNTGATTGTNTNNCNTGTTNTATSIVDPASLLTPFSLE